MSSPKESIARRRSKVTDEPFLVDDELLGKPLATVRRRAFAMAVDAFCWLLLALPLAIALNWLALSLQAPTFVPYFLGAIAQGQFRAPGRAQATLELMRLVQRRRPEILPASVHQALQFDDVDAFIEAFDATGISYNLEVAARGRSEYDPNRSVLILRDDIVFGQLSSMTGMFTFWLLYFTVATRLGRGRTPGKLLAGIRVRRLDGKPLAWRDSLDRAGGYAASLSTFGLGFLQAVRDLNRQALHDRIAGTVVLHEREIPLWRRLLPRG